MAVDSYEHTLQEPGAERLARQRRGSGFRLDGDLDKNVKIRTNKSGNVPAELATQTELRAGGGWVGPGWARTAGAGLASPGRLWVH